MYELRLYPAPWLFQDLDKIQRHLFGRSDLLSRRKCFNLLAKAGCSSHKASDNLRTYWSRHPVDYAKEPASLVGLLALFALFSILIETSYDAIIFHPSHQLTLASLGDVWQGQRGHKIMRPFKEPLSSARSHSELLAIQHEDPARCLHIDFRLQAAKAVAHATLGLLPGETFEKV
eukprot:833733-Pelagomonas_calceolata.AAC.1